MKKLIISIILQVILLSIFVSRSNSEITFMDFNEVGASGQTWPGWTWSNDVAFGHHGWTLDADGPWGGGETYFWGYGPRSFEFGSHALNEYANPDIINTDIAPSTSSGNALHISNDNSSEIHPAWWLWYDGQPLQDRGITDSNTDRWSFYIKITGIDALPKTNNSNFTWMNMNMGTYLCWGSGGIESGDACPFEGPGNQHYYHYLALEPGGWIHVLLDRHPQHLRGSNVVGDNPSFILSGKHYMAQLNQFYLQTYHSSDGNAEFIIDEIKFYSTADTIETSQNDDSITSVWVGYFPTTGKWQIAWMDQSFEDGGGENLNDNTYSTFQVKWSTSPITSANWSSATDIVGEYYTGTYFTGDTDASIIRRMSPWRTNVWTQFDLPDGTETENSQLHFAIKDVSVTGQHTGTNWPYNVGDAHNAPSSDIHTIDYYLEAVTTYPSKVITRGLNRKVVRFSTVGRDIE